MNARERFRATMRFQKTDHAPLMEFWKYEQETIERWFQEGLAIEPPEPSESLVASMFEKGFVQAGDMAQVARYFDLDLPQTLSIKSLPLPPFPETTISEDETYRVYTDQMGCTMKAHKTDPRIYMHLDHPIGTLEDLSEIERAVGILGRRGIKFEEFVNNYYDGKILPIFRITFEGQDEFFYDEKQFEKRLGKLKGSLGDDEEADEEQQ